MDVRDQGSKWMAGLESVDGQLPKYHNIISGDTAPPEKVVSKWAVSV